MRKTLILLFSLFLMTTAVSAQSNSTDKVLKQLDNGTYLSNVEISERGNATFTFHSEVPKIITITDVNSIETSGTGNFNFKSVRLGIGTTKVQMQLERKGQDYTVMITDHNNGIYWSNPERPFFASVTVSDLYTVPWVMGVEFSAFILGIISWRKYKLGKRMRRIA